VNLPKKILILKKNSKYFFLLVFSVNTLVCRILCVGKNQLDDILRQCRERVNSSVWRKEKIAIKDLVPRSATLPVVHYWWQINVGFVSEQDIQV
jgi:hypothetical protein